MGNLDLNPEDIVLLLQQCLNNFNHVEEDINSVLFTSDDFFSAISSKIQVFYSSSQKISTDAYVFTGILSSKKFINGVENLKEFSL